jgi:hypothetical protein
VKNEPKQPFFQFSLRWLLVVVFLIAVWLTFLLRGPEGSGLVVAVSMGFVFLIAGHLAPLDDPRRGCLFAVGMFLYLLLCISFVRLLVLHVFSLTSPR